MSMMRRRMMMQQKAAGGFELIFDPLNGDLPTDVGFALQQGYWSGQIVLTNTGDEVKSTMTHDYANASLYIPEHLSSDHCSITVDKAFFSWNAAIYLVNSRGNGTKVIFRENHGELLFYGTDSVYTQFWINGRSEAIKLELNGDKFSAWYGDNAVYENEECYQVSIPAPWGGTISDYRSGIYLRNGYFGRIEYKEW